MIPVRSQWGHYNLPRKMADFLPVMEDFPRGFSIAPFDDRGCPWSAQDGPGSGE